MDKGILYVMSTFVTGLVKVGKTGLGSYEQRMYNLEHNGYCNVTGLKRIFAIEVDEYSKKENLFKSLFQKSRVADTELYSLDLEQVVQLLSSFEGKQIYPKDKSKEQVFDKANKIEIEHESINKGKYLSIDKIESCTNKKPICLKLDNDFIKISKMIEVLKYFCDYLYKNFPNELENYAYKKYSIGKARNPFFTKDNSLLRSSYNLKNSDIYIELNLSSNSIINIIKHLMNKFDIDSNKLMITFK